MIDEIVEKTKSNKGKRNDLTSGSPDPEVSKETNVKLAADIAGVGKMTDTRLKKETLR